MTSPHLREGLEESEQLQHDNDHNDNSDDVKDVSVHMWKRCLTAQPTHDQMFRYLLAGVA